MKHDDTRYFTSQILNAYLEMIYGILSLRAPQVQDILIQIAPEAEITSSYSNQNENLVIKGKEILESFRAEGFKNVKSLQNSFKQVNKMFLTSMWDILTQHKRYDAIAKEPEIQFFRHIRNGCAHDGKLNLDKLNYPAKWRDKEILLSMKEKEVFPEILKAGDAILLVLDINNKFFTPIKL